MTLSRLALKWILTALIICVECSGVFSAAPGQLPGVVGSDGDRARRDLVSPTGIVFACCLDV